MSVVRICFSASLHCTGVDPCQMCASQMKRYVLSHLITKLGLNASRQQAAAVFQAFDEGWMRFRAAIEGDPSLRSQVRPVDLEPILATIDAMMQAEQAQQERKREEAIEAHGVQSTATTSDAANLSSSPFSSGPSQWSGEAGPGTFASVPVHSFGGGTIPSVAAPVASPEPISAPSSMRAEIEQRRGEEERQRMQSLATSEEAVSLEELLGAVETVEEMPAPIPPTVLGSVMGPNFVPKHVRGAHGPTSLPNGNADNSASLDDELPSEEEKH